jgi:hypothetical protein
LAYFCLAELRRYVPHGFWRRGFVSIEMRADNARRSGSEEIADSQRARLLGSAICHLQFAIFW